jgi:predicted membrane chloride channel (bestrophin family)
MITSRLPRSASVWRPLLVPTIMLLTWDVGVTVAFQLNWFEFPGITIQYTLYGTAIALFLGFMVNAGYARWWEARTLWGSIVNHSRNVAREATTLLDPTVPNARRELGPDMVRAQIAYVHSLRTSLRQQDPPPEIDRYLSRDAAVRVKNASSGPTATLTHLGRLLAEARRRGMIDDFARVQVESTLSVLTDAQGGLERIKKTPLPVQYRPHVLHHPAVRGLPGPAVVDADRLGPGRHDVPARGPGRQGPRGPVLRRRARRPDDGDQPHDRDRPARDDRCGRPRPGEPRRTGALVTRRLPIRH